jgi:hypothetical protein
MFDILSVRYAATANWAFAAFLCWLPQCCVGLNTPLVNCGGNGGLAFQLRYLREVTCHVHKQVS